MRRLLASSAFRVPAYNRHYEGAYDERAMRWRRLGAHDKAGNLRCLLGDAVVDGVLEVGCGTGAVIAAIARSGLGRRHAGVDLADPGPHRDPEAAGLALGGFDGRRLPFADGDFDLVFASHVLEHVPEPRALLGEMARVSARWIYVEVPCELHLRTNRRDLQQSLDIGHINAYTPESLRLLVETSGLGVKRQAVFDNSLAVHAFGAGRAKGLAKLALRRTLLALGPRLATRLATYNTGVLIDKRG